MKLTREGKRFLLAAVLIAIAALNTGNNLIYLILSLMLSFAVLSYAVLRINLAGVTLAASFAGPVFAGEQAHASLTVFNRKSLPAYSLEIHAAEADGSAYCAYVGAHGSAPAELRMLFARRGVYGYRDFSIRSGFPFILFEMQRTVPVAGSLLVYPALRDVSGILDQVDNLSVGGAFPAAKEGDDLYALREYRDGDDWRRLHWKASARHDALIMREYAEQRTQIVTVVIDNRLPAGGELFETAVSLAASVAAYFIGMGRAVRLVSCRKVIPFGSGEGHLCTILDILGMIREEDGCNDVDLSTGAGLLVTIMKSIGSPAISPLDAGKVMYADSV